MWCGYALHVCIDQMVDIRLCCIIGFWESYCHEHSLTDFWKKTAIWIICQCSFVFLLFGFRSSFYVLCVKPSSCIGFGSISSHSVEILHLVEPSFSFFMICAFGVLPKKLLHDTRSQRSVFSSKSFIILTLKIALQFCSF